MKPLFLLALAAVALPTAGASQMSLGIKGGTNFAKVTKASNVKAENATGFHAGVFLSQKKESVLGYRTELIFSRQGYDFQNATTTGTVKLDYLLLPQLMQVNITKYVSIQAGFQLAYLLNAKADSSTTRTGNQQVDDLIELFNRFDYGVSGGVEVHPYAGILIGARINLSLGNLYKDIDPTDPRPNFFPTVDAKNNVVQVFAGYRF